MQANQAVSSLLDALPAPTAEALQFAGNALQSAAAKLVQYVMSDPKAGAAAAGLVISVPVVANWKARFAGYSGQLQPDKAASLLSRRNFALIDIRYFRCCRQCWLAVKWRLLLAGE